MFLELLLPVCESSSQPVGVHTDSRWLFYGKVDADYEICHSGGGNLQCDLDRVYNTALPTVLQEFLNFEDSKRNLCGKGAMRTWVGDFGAFITIFRICTTSRSHSHMFTLAVCPIFYNPNVLRSNADSEIHPRVSPPFMKTL